MTKKSVKASVFRRSSTTMSAAFLSRAAWMTAVTAFGSFGTVDRVRGVRVVVVAAFSAAGVLVVRLGALAGDAFVFAMQVVYRSVQMMREDVPGDCRRHEIIDAFVRDQPGPNQRGRHVARARLHHEYRRVCRLGCEFVGGPQP